MKRLWLAHKEFIGPWVCERIKGHWNPDAMYAAGVGHAENGPENPDGGMMWENYTGPGGSAMLHIAADKPRWATRDFFWAAANYSFNTMQVKKIITSTSSANAVGLRFNERVGFVYECTVKDAFPTGDAIIRTMTREQCRWLDKKPAWAEEAEAA